jgi:hypothetical protein
MCDDVALDHSQRMDSDDSLEAAGFALNKGFTTVSAAYFFFTPLFGQCEGFLFENIMQPMRSHTP